MDFPKPSQDAVNRFKAALPPEISVKPIFGQVAGFLNGNLIGGTWGETVMLRLSPEDRMDLEDQGGTLFDPMGGRPMREYRVLPLQMTTDPEELKAWVLRSVRVTSLLPAKTPKKKKT